MSEFLELVNRHTDPHHTGNTAEETATHSAAIVARLADMLRQAQLECMCETQLHETLTHFAALEQRRVTDTHFLNARDRREQIETMLYFLNDLDELGPAEQDRSVYADIALLFEDIARAAHEGAYSMWQLAQRTTRETA